MCVLIGISRLLCSYCTRYSYCQNHRRITANFPLFGMIWYGWIQSPAVSKDKIYDDKIFADRFRYQFTMFVIHVLVSLSRLPRAHIAYEIDVAKITAVICWIFQCLAWLMRLNSNVCRAQTTMCTMMKFSLVDSVINELCLTYEYR